MSSSHMTYETVNELSEIFFDKNKKYKKVEEELYLFSIDNDDFFFNISNIQYKKILNFLKENNIEFNSQGRIEKIKKYVLENYKNPENIGKVVIIVPLEIFIPEEELFYLKLKCK